MKDLYVHGIVKDYDKSINSINKYLFSENENLNAKIDELQQRIDKAYNSLGILLQILEEQSGDKDIKWILERLNPIQEILGDKENE